MAPEKEQFGVSSPQKSIVEYRILEESLVNCTRTAEQTEIPLRGQTRCMGQQNHALDWEAHIGATWQIRLNDARVAAK